MAQPCWREKGCGHGRDCLRDMHREVHREGIGRGPSNQCPKGSWLRIFPAKIKDIKPQIQKALQNFSRSQRKSIWRHSTVTVQNFKDNEKGFKKCAENRQQQTDSKVYLESKRPRIASSVEGDDPWKKKTVHWTSLNQRLLLCERQCQKDKMTSHRLGKILAKDIWYPEHTNNS